MARRPPERATYRLELVDCGRCRKPHGPYWYAYWKEGGRTVSAYVGKRRYRFARPPAAPPATFDAHKILGVSRTATSAELKRAFRAAALRWHPDRPGGNLRRMQEVNRAWAVLGPR